MDDDEDDIFDDQPEFLAERGAWNRVGGIDIGLGLGEAINLKKSGYTINEKFKLIALATINIINELNFESVSFSTPQITHILSLVEKIPDFQYKNPSAFILGYMVALHSNYSTLKINKDMLKTAIEIYTEIEDQLFTKIGEDDIIRYARLCLLNKLK